MRIHCPSPSEKKEDGQEVLLRSPLLFLKKVVVAEGLKTEGKGEGARAAILRFIKFWERGGILVFT